MKWINTKNKNPEFGETVLVWCKIYGTFLASYECIGEFNGDKYGNWRDFKGNLGILTPTYWMQIPKINEESEKLHTHEDQPISDFAKQVKELITKEWGSHNLDAFVEAFKEVDKS